MSQALKGHESLEANKNNFEDILNIYACMDYFKVYRWLNTWG